MNNPNRITVPRTDTEQVSSAPSATAETQLNAPSPQATAAQEAGCRKTAAIICFTETGFKTSCGIAGSLPHGWRSGITRGFGPGKVKLADWTAQHFPTADALVFVGATGIAVRAIAPHTVSKGADPAVVAVDERGQWSIPLLSGHLGGANELALAIAQGIGATPVITTATDINGLWAVDSWAKSQGLLVRELDRIKLVSGKILRGETVKVASDFSIEGSAPKLVCPVDAVEEADVTISPRLDSADGALSRLHLVPRLLVAGIGCRRDTGFSAIQEAFGMAMRQAGIDPLALAAVHSIDLKANEAGLLEFCERMGVPFTTHTTEELAAVPGNFTPSDFVKKTTGVDNVCERSALLGARQLAARTKTIPQPQDASLVLGKLAQNGVTVALAYVQPQLAW
ncbi:MAG: cobalt-precorrin 5A hydrolase [Eggerthellaceae bacterium]